ncbi:katanin p60 ATPase-containing subunit A-like 2 isoform X4 [Bacillus rossius redtenbacheri]|uniref:katanin p60 ATPase-containing subunit A-like 2 isoform X4 n=1 Tax=Bacillus rossius redtenbacheri TaxID=93214 RepID=UPI002FDD5433
MALLSSSLRHRIRECGEKRAADSRRKMACLVADYLQEEGYHRTAACFRDEAPLLRHYELCDNVSLSGVLTQFEEYHSLRFHKEAKVCKKSPDGPPQQDKTSRPLKTRGTSPPGADGPPQQDVTSRPLKTHGTSAPGAEGPPQLDVTCRPMETRGTSPTGETPELSWDDVVGQQRAKSALMMAVVYPAKYPQLFRGLVQPARSMLLYGPPGTGKTMLARVVAHHSQATFFDVPASSVVSKWRGESEKLLGAVFQAARSQAPAIVFMDELDSIASRRGLDGEHEASRRLLAELLLLMDRLLSQADERLFLLAATNVPWQLDPAVLRQEVRGDGARGLAGPAGQGAVSAAVPARPGERAATSVGGGGVRRAGGSHSRPVVLRPARRLQEGDPAAGVRGGAGVGAGWQPAAGAALGHHDPAGLRDPARHEAL